MDMPIKEEILDSLFSAYYFVDLHKKHTAPHKVVYRMMQSCLSIEHDA